MYICMYYAMLKYFYQHIIHFNHIHRTCIPTNHTHTLSIFVLVSIRVQCTRTGIFPQSRLRAASPFRIACNPHNTCVTTKHRRVYVLITYAYG